MSNEGKSVSLHRGDRSGGFIKSGDTDLIAFPVNDITTANPGLAVAQPGVLMPASLRAHSPVLDAGPWSVTIAGVTGDDEASVNGARTATRTGDNTITIGVDTTLLDYTATSATILGLTYSEDDANIPSRKSYDYSKA